MQQLLIRIAATFVLTAVIIHPLAIWQRCAAAEKNELTAADVELALKRATRYLISQQDKNDGHWRGYETNGTGQTALVLLALLNAGSPVQSPDIQRGLEYLRASRPTLVYETSLQVMVFCLAEPNRDLPRIRRLVDLLIESQTEKGESAGGWGYDCRRTGTTDPSNSQFAALAMWDAQRAGISVPRETLLAIAGYWNKRQFLGQRGVNPDPRYVGGWGYNNFSVTGSMTCAGIASLLMAEEAAQIADVQINGDAIACCGAEEVEVRKAELGFQWLSHNFQISSNPNGSYWSYYLYGLERVGRLTGKRMINNRDWYREGCAEVLRNQDATQGNINDSAANAVTPTALAVLFLSKGRRQIVIARARLAEDELPRLQDQFSFKHHDHAVNNLNGHIEQAWKRDLAWQSVTLGEAEVTDLLESPVLFISGSERFQPTAKTKSVLKEYVEQGGFIFAEARNGNGCDGSAFEKSFTALMAELFGTEMRKLDRSHPVWSAQVPIDVGRLPDDFWLYGIESCCRTAVIYSPISLACRWELHRAYGVPLEASPKVLAELDEATAVGLNVVTYATGRELKNRFEKPLVELDKSESIDIVRGTLRLPRLRHAGGDNETPKAIRNLLTAFGASIPTLIDNESPLITPSGDGIAEVTMLYIHGRNVFEYSESDRAALRTFFENGGVLLGDSICASDQFTESLKSELARILPEATWVPVGASDPVLTSQYGGFDIRNVTLNDPAAAGPVATARREGPPVLERLVFRQRTVCLFSIYDLSCALESQGVTQCRGYLRDDAARIGINMILAAMME